MAKPEAEVFENLDPSNVEPAHVEDELVTDAKGEKVDPELDSPTQTRDDIYSKSDANRHSESDLTQIEDPKARANLQMVTDQAAGIAHPEEYYQAIAAGEDPDAPEVVAAVEDEPGKSIPAKTVDTNAEMVTLVVYGQEVDVTQQDIDDAGGTAELQKRIAASVKLEKAADYEKSLRTYEGTLNQRLAEVQKREAALTRGKVSPPGTDRDQNKPPQRGALSDAELDGIADELVSGMFSGSEEEAKKQVASALSKVTGRDNNPYPDRDELVGAVADELQRRGQMDSAGGNLPRTDVTTANEMFVKSYPELQSNADYPAFRMVQAEIEQVASSPIMRGSSQEEIVREASERVRMRLAGGKPEELNFSDDDIPGGTSPDVLERIGDRLRLKSRSIVPRSMGSQRRTAPETTPKRNTGSDYVAAARKARGQPAT